MNTGTAVYYGDTSFSADVISFFPQKELMRFWKRMGIVLTEDASGRVYPFTLQSSTILDALKSKLKMFQNIWLKEDKLLLKEEFKQEAMIIAKVKRLMLLK